jgi:hypothetical protein
MESKEMQATPDEIYPAAICMLLFPLGYLGMESTEEIDYSRIQPTKKLGYLGQNLYCSHQHDAVSIWLSLDGVY